MERKVTIRMVVLVAVMLLAGACSTKKNTAGTRMFHALTARFNTMHNGQLAFNEGMEAQQKGHKDNYTEVLPFYISTVKATQSLGKGNYETAVTKSEKAIKLHSIKKKPTVSGNKKRSPREKEFMARKEFNPYLYRAWFLMAEAQFQQGNFIEAASVYNYILRIYSTQPDIVCVARARLARCYVAMDWPYDAEDLLRNMGRDSITIRGTRERNNAYAAYMVATEQYEQAIPYMQQAIKKGGFNKVQRARLNFLMGQIQHQLGQNEQAYKSLSRVVRSNPPYEMEFNARILQTEVMSRDHYKQMIKKLQRMAKSDKNKDYLDQVYYAIGNIYQSVQDTARCIGAWEKGVEESTRGGYAKAMLLLNLSQLYWERENYIDAQRTYQQCIAILDKEHDEYKESARRSKILDELAPPLGDVKLQDSLQALAKMPEKEYLAAIDRVITALKKKEKEEAKRAAANGGTPSGSGNAAGMAQNQNNANRPNNAAANAGQRGGAWYFYNPMTVQQGKQEFQRRWGQRANEDNWRRSNKRMERTGSDGEEYEDDPEAISTADSIAAVEEAAAEQALKDSLANDPHHREYYLKQIPFEEDQLQASHQILQEGLYKAGVLETDKLENFPLAEKTLLRVLADYPDFDKKADVYYHLFLVYGRFGDKEKAEHYRQLLKDEYPDEKITRLLSNPNYEMIARDGKHIEDSLYAATYQAYQQAHYDTVNANYQYHTENFEEGAHRAKMMFLHAMTQLYQGDRKAFLDELKEVVQKYSKDEVSEMAQYMVKGLEDGRQLSGDKFDASSIWSRRTAGGEQNDSTQQEVKLQEERYSEYMFVLAYPSRTLNENQLLFEMARFNFTSFMVRDFEIETILDKDLGVSMMTVKGFQSYDEVHAYAQQLYANAHMNEVLRGIRSLLISAENFKLLGKSISFDDYKSFYDEKLAPINVPDMEIDDTQPIVNEDEYEEPEEQPGQQGGDADEDDADDFPFGF